MAINNGLGQGGKGGDRTPLASVVFRQTPEVLTRQLNGLAQGTAGFLKTADIASEDVTHGMNMVFRELSSKL